MQYIEKFGLRDTTEVVDLIREQPYAIKHAVEAEKLDCEFELRRSFDVFIDANEAERNAKLFQGSLKAGQKWTRETDSVGEKFAEQVS